MKKQISQFRKNFSEVGLWNMLKRFARNMGTKTTYMVLLLYFAYQRKDTPAWARRIVLGSLGYFITIFDAIPDLTPFVGFTDDIGVLSFGLVTVAAYIDEEVRGKAREKLREWFGGYEEEDLVEIDQKL